MTRLNTPFKEDVFWKHYIRIEAKQVRRTLDGYLKKDLAHSTGIA
jgi:hypothetical protein